MIDGEKRDWYEKKGREAAKKLYDYLAETHNIDITDWYEPPQKDSHYDISCKIDGEVKYIENKTRNIRYNTYKDEGYYLDVNKTDLDLFNYYFPQDNILMITNRNKINDLLPQDTYIKKDVYCDPDSKPKVKKNLVIPHNRWWVYNTTNNQLISRPI